MTLVHSGEAIEPHTIIRIDACSGIAHTYYWYMGFHSACVDIARQLIQLSPTSKLDSFCDIWITLNARHLKGPKGHGAWDHAASVPRKTTRGAYVWSQDTAYYLPHWTAGDTGQWWRIDPLHIPNLTNRLLENLQHISSQPSKSSRLFQERFNSLPQELKDKIISHLGSDLATHAPNNLLPQWYWKQLFIQIPFLWDLDVNKVQQFPDVPGKEWDWERLVQQLMTRPTKPTILSNEELWDGARTKVWSYKPVGLDVPRGLTNRRRIWQILGDMDPKELDVLNDPLFWADDLGFDDFVAATGREGGLDGYFHVPDDAWDL